MAYCTKFELKACGVFIHRGKLLLVRAKGHMFYFLPGGHIEFREQAKDTLKREMKEEFGIGVRSATQIGIVENAYKENNVWHHELIIVFLATLAKAPGDPIEPHLESALIEPKKLSTLDLRPHTLRNALVTWRRNGKVFFSTQMGRK